MENGNEIHMVRPAYTASAYQIDALGVEYIYSVIVPQPEFN